MMEPIWDNNGKNRPKDYNEGFRSGVSEKTYKRFEKYGCNWDNPNLTTGERQELIRSHNEQMTK